MKERFIIERTKSGLPAMWEQGGGLSNTGRSVIIAGVDGRRLQPIYVRRRGPLACGEHALFVIRPGCIIIQADHHRGDFEVLVYKITNIDDDSDQIEAELLCCFEDGGWFDCQNQTPIPGCPAEFVSAVDEAMLKAQCYHCREPHYFAE